MFFGCHLTVLDRPYNDSTALTINLDDNEVTFE